METCAKNRTAGTERLDSASGSEEGVGTAYKKNRRSFRRGVYPLREDQLTMTAMTQKMVRLMTVSSEQTPAAISYSSSFRPRPRLRKLGGSVV